MSLFDIARAYAVSSVVGKNAEVEFGAFSFIFPSFEVLKNLFHGIAWVYGFAKDFGMDLCDSFLQTNDIFSTLWSIYEALILINSRAHVGFLCQHTWQ